ncbi:MAG: ceramidase CerN [Halioglobus sp.]
MTAEEQAYLVGRGMADVTGPLVGVPLWGFGRPDQIGQGLHIRLRSRAFIVAQADSPERRLVFASVDLGSVDHHVTLEVVERLQARYGAGYTLDNVIISATHTHAGPGGHWHSRTDTGLDGGLYPAHFEVIAKGITESIVRAHEDLQPGGIMINSGRVPDAGVNRSAVAYLENPSDERARYEDNTNTQMLLLKFFGADGAIGLINWYALHPTAMNFHNLLVSGDHKGYASLRMEQRFGTTYASEDDFVAAFAQADPGDVTPNTNLDNTGPGATDVETTQIMGERQMQVAQHLFDTASESLHGPVETRRVYVDLSDYEVDGRFTGSGTQTTCPSAYGYSFAGGSTEDGGGHFLFREGMLEQQAWRDWLIRLVTGAPRWTEEVKSCQAPKPILFQTGTGDPPLQSQVHSFTLARIGQLVIIAVPAEVTTMAGRRLRASVERALGDWAQYLVLAGYSNGFAGYVTTPEEYMLQQYEGAHTLHGRWSLPAYQQIFSQLAAAIEADSTVEVLARYDDWRTKAQGMPLPTGQAGSPPGEREFGDALTLKRKRYQTGATVVADFWSTNPTAHFGRVDNFLAVESETPSGWQSIRSDGNWDTRVRWRGVSGSMVAQLSWTIPAGTAPGNYRISHFGYAPDGFYSGATGVFEVIASEP